MEALACSPFLSSTRTLLLLFVLPFSNNTISGNDNKDCRFDLDIDYILNALHLQGTSTPFPSIVYHPTPFRGTMLTKKLKSSAVEMASTETKKFLAEDRVLVYQYRPNNNPVVKGGLAVIPRHELDNILATRKSFFTSLLSSHKLRFVC